MANFKALDHFLQVNKFQLLATSKSENFGDEYNIFSNEELEIKISSTKSDIIIDVRKRSSGEKWFDLILIKSLIDNHEKFTVSLSVEELSTFLKDNFEKILDLFKQENYDSTIARLQDLERSRIKQNFPQLFKPDQ
ncbi:MAG: hypothetical protein ABW007_19660 [Chitinophagaceae bacterium]